MWSYYFEEFGGYDCMTDAFYITNPSFWKEDTWPFEKEKKPIITIDFCDFGQKADGSNRNDPSIKDRAEACTKYVVDALNEKDKSSIGV